MAEEAAKLRRLFRQLDADGSGSLDFDECKVLLEKMGKDHFAGKNYQEIFAEMDTDGNGTVELLEFEEWYHHQAMTDQNTIMGGASRAVGKMALKGGMKGGSMALKTLARAGGKAASKARKGTTEFDGETEEQIKRRSVKSGWVVHVAKNMNQINVPRLIACSHDGVHVLQGNTESVDEPAREIAWLDLTLVGREEGPAQIEHIKGAPVRGMVPQIIRLSGTHDLLEDPDPDYEDFEFACDKAGLLWDWVTALKICGAVTNDYTEECHENYLHKNKPAQKKIARMQAKYDGLIDKMQAENEEKAALEAQENTSKYKQMEEQLVRDFDAGKIGDRKKCPCGSGRRFEACHKPKMDDLRTKMDTEAAARKTEQQRKEEERRAFEEGLVDLYLADLLPLKELCPCESGKQFRKCHYISLGLDKMEKGQKKQDKLAAKRAKEEERQELARQKILADAPEKLRQAESKRLDAEKKAHEKHFKAQCYDLFRKLDTDSSGELDKKEVKRGIAEIKAVVGMDDKKAQQLWKDADQDGDGTLTADEFYEFLLTAKPDFVPKMMASMDSVDSVDSAE